MWKYRIIETVENLLLHTTANLHGFQNCYKKLEVCITKNQCQFFLFCDHLKWLVGIMLSLEVHPERWPTATERPAVGIGAGHLAAHVHGHDVLPQVGLAVAALGAKDAGPQPRSVLQNLTRHH
jgi:hypothetical protein